MSLIDDLNAPKVPDEWQARQVYRGDEVDIVTGPIKPVDNDAELIEQFGYNIDEIEIIGNINQWRKQDSKGNWTVSYQFKHRPKTSSLDLPALYAAAKAKPLPPIKAAPSNRTTVVVLSDVQAGKVGARGGTPELIDRLQATQERLATHLAIVKPKKTVLAEAGDIFEGFESGGNPMFTNDLSLAQQIDLASTTIYDFINVQQRHGHVDVMGVPSNHTAWKNGRQQLGRPGDDLGLLCHRQVSKVAAAAGLDVEWHLPPIYDEAVTFDVDGTVIGMVHGNQFGGHQAPTWWARQLHGGQPVGAADILISGHYHHLSILPTGRNPYTGRSKWWLQAPTLDNGSDWFRNIRGDDSDPGLLVFDITEDGFDLQSLTIL